MTESFPILRFNPLLKRVLWGGRRIAPFKGMPPQGGLIGESWEISAVPGHETTVADGPFKGMKINELMACHGREIMGGRLTERYGADFPLLIKFLDTADDTSVQVHPHDGIARPRHNCPGKTEMWVSIDPLDDAFIYSGLKRCLTPGEYRRSIADNTIIDALGKHFTREDDVFFLPAGQIHSIGRGNFLLEIQQTSDITYRIYDFDRRDAEGLPRPLHVEESMDAVILDDYTDTLPTRIPEGVNSEFVLVECGHFTATAIRVSGSYTLELAARDSFTIIVAIKGDAMITDPDGRVTELRQGTTLLIPATMPRIRIDGDCKVVTSYVR